MADAGEGERAVEFDDDRCCAWKESSRFKLARESKSCSHRTDGMRAGRSDADFEEFKETGVHDVVTTEFIVKGSDVGSASRRNE